MKYCKYRNSVRMKKNSSGEWETIPGSEERLLIRSYSNEQDCYNSIIGSIPSASGMQVSTITGDGELTNYPCNNSDSNNYTVANIATVISMTLGTCDTNYYFASDLVSYTNYTGVAKALRRVGFEPNAVVPLISGKRTLCFVTADELCDLVIPNNLEYDRFFLQDPEKKQMGIQELSINLTENGYFIIRDAYNIKKISIGGSITTIPSYAIYNCNELEEVVMPETVTSILEYNFYKCPKLTGLTIPSSVVSIGNWFCAYSSAPINSLPNSVTTIGSEFMRGSTVSSFTFSNNVTSIDGAVFYACKNLKWVEFGTGLTSLGSGVCYECPNLEYLIFHGDVPSGSNWFGEVNCPVYVPDEYLTSWRSNSYSKYKVRPLSWFNG